MFGITNHLLWVLFSLLCLDYFRGALSEQPPPHECKYGFFFLTYRQPFAARAVFRRIRLFYPTAPMYILTDVGGVDLSLFCAQDANCRSVRSKIHFGHAYRQPKSPMTNHSLLQMFTYFDYFAEAAQWSRCEFVLQVEEDVWYNRRIGDHEAPPAGADAGGGNNNRTGDNHSPALQRYMRDKTGREDLGILGYVAGGSYFRTQALIDCVHNHMRSLDWFAMHALDRRLGAAWDTVPGVMFLLAGYRTAYWEAVCDRPFIYARVYGRPCANATIVHSKLDNPARALYVKHLNESVTSFSDLL